MQVTSVTVGWSETCSLPGYNNVHPSVSMTASVAASESADGIVDVLMDACKAKVQAEVDIALRRRGCRPQYEPPAFGQPAAVGAFEEDDEEAERAADENDFDNECRF